MKQDNKKFWDRYARFYDAAVLRSSSAAYREMYRLMGNCLSSDMDVLEIATGTGLIALNVAPYVHHMEATDYAPQMIAAAQKKRAPANLGFSVQDATNLPYEEGAFDAVIIANALHVMPRPGVVLAEIRRVLKPGGRLIAPNFAHGGQQKPGLNLNALILKLIGFETHARWSPQEYVGFIGENGFCVDNFRVLRASFPLVYLEATPK